MLTAEEIAKHTTQTEMVPFEERLMCTQPGCSGELKFTGSGFTMIDTAWNHRCDHCGCSFVVNGTHFPRIVHKPKGTDHATE